MSEKDGDPAFPAGTNYLVMQKGMSLRDYFAGQALAGFCALRVTQEDCDRAGVDSNKITGPYAKNAYAFADAMLKERAK